MITNTLTTH